MGVPVKLKNLNLMARVVMAETSNRAVFVGPSQIDSFRKGQHFLALMANNRGRQKIGIARHLHSPHIVVSTQCGSVKVERRESVCLGLRQPFAESDYGK